MTADKDTARREGFSTHWKPYAELLSYLKPYRGRFFFGVSMGVLYALLNGSIPLIVKYVGDAVFPGGANQEAIRQAAMSDQGGKIDAVVLACLLVPLVMILRGFFSFMNSYQMSWVSLRVLTDIRSKLFASIVGQSMEFFDKARAGKLMSRVMNDTQVAQSTLSQLSVSLFKQPIALVAGVAAVMVIDWKFSLITLVLFPVCIVPVALFGRKVRKAGEAEERLAGEMNVILQETFAGIRLIKSYAEEKLMVKMFNAAAKRQFRNSLRVRKSTEITSPLVEIVAE